ncbi:MAG: sulfotransferase [Thiocapsa sp.]|uniref:sulfotransferase family protein n=1 Tax=Thiocapsa sp. TaxID=2024551 RepID=UPI001BCB92D1|nr:sulfotransferase [Thiocapsa sp.]QVL47675.1 MAG: sulfotransferase [Thiocapsa sp.]
MLITSTPPDLITGGANPCLLSDKRFFVFAQAWLFIRVYFKSIFAYRSAGAKWSVRHVVFLIVFPPVFISLELFNRLCFLLDELFYHGYREIDVKSPFFIVGFPRSGTTYLHRLLVKDNQCTSMYLWEILFAPSILQKKFILWLGIIDQQIGSPLYRLISRIEDRRFAEERKMHHISLFEPEEDEISLLHIFASAFQIQMFPFEEMLRFTHFDTAFSETYRSKVMSFYKNLIRRHLYVFGPDKYYLSKNPAFSCKIHSLYAAFPDAKIVCAVRTPFDAVPSAISWMSHNSATFHKTESRFETETIIDAIGHWYTYPLEALEAYPKATYEIMLYDDLVAHPSQVVTDLYAKFQIEIREDFENHLEVAERRAKAYRSEHHYQLAEMGLSREWILERFSDTFERFGFSRQSDQFHHDDHIHKM